MSVDYTRGVIGRDPIGKTMVEALLANHPDWSDQQISDRINYEYEDAIINATEVAHWRAQIEAAT